MVAIEYLTACSMVFAVIAKAQCQANDHRQLVNFMSKYIEADWVQAAIAKARVSGCTWARVACSWHQTQTATGRLSSSSPNLQV